MFLYFQIPVETAGTMKVTPGAGSSWSTIALGYRRIESDQPKWEKVSIDLVEINMIDRYASEAGVFSRGEREDNICIPGLDFSHHNVRPYSLLFFSTENSKHFCIAFLFFLWTFN